MSKKLVVYLDPDNLSKYLNNKEFIGYNRRMSKKDTMANIPIWAVLEYSQKDYCIEFKITRIENW